MTEESILAALRKRLPASCRGNLVLGIGDDAAIYRPKPGHDLVFTTDMMHEGRHFLRDYSPETVGWKGLARSLSDIAAMGAKPEFALLSLALGPWVKARWVNAFYGGFLDLAGQHTVRLAGGDLAQAAHTSLDVVVAGSVPRGRAFRRKGARAGDSIYVSGQLGGGILGLRRPKLLAARKRHLRPEPRIALGLALRRRAIPSAMMDLSDGVSTDLHRLLIASGVAADLDGTLPIFPGATEEDALHGGDDYELLFTTRPGTPVPVSLAGLPLTRIGTVTKGAPGSLRLRGKAIAALGWDHFRQP